MFASIDPNRILASQNVLVLSVRNAAADPRLHVRAAGHDQWMDKAEFLKQYGDSLRAALRHLRGVLQSCKKAKRLERALVDQLLTAGLSEGALSSVRQAELPAEELLKCVNHDLTLCGEEHSLWKKIVDWVMKLFGAGPRIPAADWIESENSADCDNAECALVCERFQAVLGAYLGRNPGNTDARVEVLRSLAQRHLATELQREAIVQDPAHVRVWLRKGAHSVEREMWPDAPGPSVVRHFTISLAQKQWSLMAAFAVDQNEGHGKHFDVAALHGISQAVEMCFALPVFGFFLNTATNPGAFEEWLDEKPSDYCARVLAACWPVPSHLEPRALKFLTTLSPQADDGAIAENMWRIAAKLAKRAKYHVEFAALKGNCSAAFTKAISAQPPHVLLGWLEWYYPTSSAQLDTLVNRTIAAHDPEPWVEVLCRATNASQGVSTAATRLFSELVKRRASKPLKNWKLQTLLRAIDAFNPAFAKKLRELLKAHGKYERCESFADAVLYGANGQLMSLKEYYRECLDEGITAGETELWGKVLN